MPPDTEVRPLPKAAIPMSILGFLYVALSPFLGIVQISLAVSLNISGPYADSDPSEIFLTLPAYVKHLRGLAIGWASVGLLVNIVLGVNLPWSDFHKEERWPRVRATMLKGPWVPWSLLSLVIWGVYVGVHTGRDGGLRSWWDITECGGAALPASQCAYLWSAWVVGWIFVMYHLIILVLLGLMVILLGVVIQENVESGRENHELGVVNAPRENRAPSS
ncbi:hypothetical protein F5144DRAFT_606839 [Chaetomium tenue]|uniref:Uncharacterized protein n=1 Tax=Chaetomium tenue TaxID=1854479 RepID=A0ACB7NVB8_9PEZI|nr:hypothetical protein F5144DRAFT_606839 [Chaetomium globosum]